MQKWPLSNTSGQFVLQHQHSATVLPPGATPHGYPGGESYSFHGGGVLGGGGGGSMRPPAVPLPTMFSVSYFKIFLNNLV